MAVSTDSHHITTWKKFTNNRQAVVGLFLLTLFSLSGLFCYLITPDNTSYGNNQIIEMQAMSPGHRQLFVVSGTDQETGWISTLLSGKKNPKMQIPIQSYQIKGDELWIRKYVDEDTAVIERLSINEITDGHPEKFNNHLKYHTYWLGTDILGRDLLSRLLIGARVSISVAIIALLVALSVGILLGGLAGYYCGKTDAVILWLISVSWSIPTVLMVFALTIAMGKGLFQIFIAIGLTMWVNVARLVRGQFKQIREMDYIRAAQLMGFSDLRVIYRHMLPNIVGPLLVTSISILASAILIEAGLSFLGLGIQPPQPSWGLMVKENYHYLITRKPMLAIIPGLAILLLVLTFNWIGNGLRDALNERD